MAVVSPPGIDPAPTPAPQRGDRTTFSARVDAFVTWISAAVAQFSAVALNVFNNATDAFNSANIATAQAASAISAAGAVAFNPATAYASGASAYSLINFKTYRRTSAGTNATDPKNDPTNWVLISNAPAPYIHVQDQKANNTSGQTITRGAWAQRNINTIVGTSTITGASVASDQITLPAGDYSFDLAVAPGVTAVTAQIQLYNATDSVALAYGVVLTGGAGTAVCGGKFTLTGTKALQIRHYIQGSGSAVVGNSIGTGAPEVYADIQIRQIAA